MNGFFQRILMIDLSDRAHRVEPMDDAVLRKYLGGKGLATHLLLEKNPGGVDPFAPENHLVLALGPVTDSPVYGSCRHGIYSKSPLTGFYAESYSGGSLAVSMSRVGYDAVVITGKAEKPTWLEITDSNVNFYDAGDLWGRETYDTEDEIKRRVGVPGVGAMVIGPAGENRVRFAVVENDYWRSAGRSGMGAVLGAKNIKAIAFHGSRVRPVADPDGLRAYARETVKDYKDHPAAQAYRNHGTPMMVALLNKAGAFPTRYWAEGHYDQWEKIDAERMVDRCKAKPKACKTCFMACGNLIEVQHGRHKSLKIEGPEYETIYAFGGLCLIDEIEEIAYLNDLCDRWGIDTISAGNLVAFAVEASRRGKISDSLDYGDPDMAADVLKKIVYRDGIGDLLAEGIKTASEELGLEDIAVHVKGMEPAGYDPRILKGMGLAYAVSDRGACHLRSTFYKPELAGMIAPSRVEDKAELFLDFEDRCTLFDCLILCRFYRDFYPWEELSNIIALTTGMDFDTPALARLAGRVTDSTRKFNIREGLTPADDRLPKRLLKESLKDGGRITPEEMETLVKDYYRLRGWDVEGVPPNPPTADTL
ncbi:aldehyde ferredoxin oxidoreductase family protein [Thermodesulfobacteriota bacterium]